MWLKVLHAFGLTNLSDHDIDKYYAQTDNISGRGSVSIMKMSLPNIIGGLVVVIIVSLATWGWQYFKEEEPKSSGIYEPTNSAYVLHKTLVGGWYGETKANYNLWLVIQPVESPHYHPQPGPILVTRDGQWQGMAYFGVSPNKNKGEEFLVLMITADSKASQVFANYLQDSANRGEWLGLQALPNGATLIDSIKVIRK